VFTLISSIKRLLFSVIKNENQRKHTYPYNVTQEDLTFKTIHKITELILESVVCNSQKTKFIAVQNINMLKKMPHLQIGTFMSFVQVP